MEIPEQDAAHMARAVELAGRGHGTTSPNPVVGCVVLDSAGAVAGEGFHAYAGGPHAEVVALAQAGERARGGTAYVTLEPCDHTGRTGPCTLALLDAGIARVVVAVADPNPKAAGGAVRLRAAGVSVTIGVLTGAAERVNEEWLTYARLGRSHVTWKFAATLDGRSAAEDGTSQWITSPEARADVHRLRAASDAIVAGVGTILADDARLTARPVPAAVLGSDAGPGPGAGSGASAAPGPVLQSPASQDGPVRRPAHGAGARPDGEAGGGSAARLIAPVGGGNGHGAGDTAGDGHGTGAGRDAGEAADAGRGARVPLRVVVDTDARTPQAARVLDDEAPTLIAVAEDAGAGLKADLLRLPRHGDGLDLLALLRELAAREVVSVFLEGGPTLAGAFIRQGLVDRVVAYVAPALLGSGRAALGAAGVRTIGQMHRLTFDEISPIGPDVRLIARPIAQPGREQ
ncbi:bifunctional diaminohydroxyphosphoribosylaminopyrimidine deaminase/5-amino-6-(5-phosphoribosylamino)uracil reductase RibD [Nonomuraea sp. NPDC049480]|uniref:bifunctional diaminohydroxyphosphoribosylaminopyrimidine deaminase/5-amino-6-(5-phosphoribosylamino)uracil reductase RibD n=1 Tax=Nonomuraea sp. NPDC049480 TaxID=3364353 RepID=UPI0037AAE58F